MKRVSKTILASAIGLGLSLPSLAHVGSAAAPHVHAGDGGACWSSRC
jgi:hypothetical protein